MTDKVMRPIRKEEYAYWDYNTDSEYETRKNSLKSEMIEEIEEETDSNLPSFRTKLKLDPDMKSIEDKYKAYHEFVTTKNMVEQQLKNDLSRAVDKMYEKLITWKKPRKWDTEISRKLIEEPKDHEALLRKLCREETQKAYYAGPKGKALQLLEISKKKSKHILNSGLPLNIAIMRIAEEGATQKINFQIPKDVFNPAYAIENKK
jgi:hypothetical protein|tara:strand:- start:50 stop:664 length:615 start_codon:yes stop_codon:yes gene_type:complete